MRGSRFFDILLDALYAQAPVLQLTGEIGWDVVISLKQNQRELYQCAVRLFARRPPDSAYVEQREGKTYAVQVWDTPDLPVSIDYPRPVRVVRSEETLTQNHYRQRQLQPESTSHEWLWITTLEPRAFPTAQVRRLGHDRWKLENNGWNDLTQHWALKHGFLHACRHRPQVTSETGERQSVPNHGLAAVTLILLLAFTLCAAFTLRHSKLFRRYRMTGIEGPANCAARCLNFRLRSALPISASSEIRKTGSAQHLRRSVRRLPSFFPSVPLVGQPQPPIWDPGQFRTPLGVRRAPREFPNPRSPPTFIFAEAHPACRAKFLPPRKSACAAAAASIESTHAHNPRDCHKGGTFGQ